MQPLSKPERPTHGIDVKLLKKGELNVGVSKNLTAASDLTLSVHFRVPNPPAGEVRDPGS
jgi:hypothetical protein